MLNASQSAVITAGMWKRKHFEEWSCITFCCLFQRQIRGFGLLSQVTVDLT